MPVLEITKDPEALTMTVLAEFDASPTRVWQVWADPRQLERWWGPPTWPATVVDHEFVEGGKVSYFMTGPEGERAHGWWRFLRIDAPRALEFEDGFADDTGEPSQDMPTTRARVALDPTAGGTRMTMVSTFGSVEQLEQLAEMGMQEGLREALGQIDALLAA